MSRRGARARRFAEQVGSRAAAVTPPQRRFAASACVHDNAQHAAGGDEVRVQERSGAAAASQAMLLGKASDCKEKSSDGE